MVNVLKFKNAGRIANKEDPDQTNFSEAVWSGSPLFALGRFGRQQENEILEHLPY